MPPSSKQSPTAKPSRSPTGPPFPSPEALQAELNRRKRQKCLEDPHEFLKHCQIYDATEKTWIPFDLWPAQAEVLDSMESEKLLIVLKARQIGMTWLALAHALRLMLLKPIASIGVFSKTAEEAQYLLGMERLRGMYSKLPDWLRGEASIVVDQVKGFTLSNGSSARAFATTGGDGRTLTWVLVDEADLQADLNSMMLAIKPTVDGGGQLVLLSKSDKANPSSLFKKIWREAEKGQNGKKTNGYKPIFLPWHVRPDRTPEWYEEQKNQSLSESGNLDKVYENYPATPEEALAPSQTDKRIATAFLQQVLEPETLRDNPLNLPGLSVRQTPEEVRQRAKNEGKTHRGFCMGADTSEGKPGGDPSALVVMDVATGEEVALLTGRFEPDIFASAIAAVSAYYGNAPVLVERNNHGHAVQLALRQLYPKVKLLRGEDNCDGWLTGSLSKVLMYNEVVRACRVKDCRVRSRSIFDQLSSIRNANLSAPSGKNDDEAMAYGLALVARARSVPVSDWRMERI